MKPGLWLLHAKPLEYIDKSAPDYTCEVVSLQE